MKGLILGCSISAGTHKLDPSHPLGEVVDNQIKSKIIFAKSVEFTGITNGDLQIQWD